MKVDQILNTKGRAVETIGKSASVMMASHKMRLAGIGALVVSGDGRSVDGIISERDIVRGLTDHGSELLKQPVHQIMSPVHTTCSPESTVAQVMAMMTRRRVRHVPVIEDGALIGIVSIGDVVKNRLDELELETGVLRDAYLASH